MSLEFQVDDSENEEVSEPGHNEVTYVLEQLRIGDIVQFSCRSG